MEPGETLEQWDDLGALQHFIIWQFCEALKSDYSDTARVFELAKPQVIIGSNYWRLEKEHAGLLDMLVKTYL